MATDYTQQGCAMIRPSGDVIFDTYKCMGAAEVERLEVGDIIELMGREDFLYYYGIIKEGPNDNGQKCVHMVNWKKKHDFIGPLSLLYLAKRDFFSKAAGLDNKNSYNNRMARDLELLKVEEKENIKNEKNRKNTDEQEGKEKKKFGKKAEKGAVTQQGSALLRPHGDRLRDSQRGMSQAMVKKLKPPDKVEILCYQDTLYYWGEVQEVDGSEELCIHLERYLKKEDYIGDFARLYIAERGQFSTLAGINKKNSYKEQNLKEEKLERLEEKENSKRQKEIHKEEKAKEKMKIAKENEKHQKKRKSEGGKKMCEKRMKNEKKEEKVEKAQGSSSSSSTSANQQAVESSHEFNSKRITCKSQVFSNPVFDYFDCSVIQLGSRLSNHDITFIRLTEPSGNNDANDFFRLERIDLSRRTFMVTKDGQTGIRIFIPFENFYL